MKSKSPFKPSYLSFATGRRWCTRFEDTRPQRNCVRWLLHFLRKLSLNHRRRERKREILWVNKKTEDIKLQIEKVDLHCSTALCHEKMFLNNLSYKRVRSQWGQSYSRFVFRLTLNQKSEKCRWDGLANMGRRWLSPAMQRWLQVLLTGCVVGQGLLQWRQFTYRKHFHRMAHLSSLQEDDFMFSPDWQREKESNKSCETILYYQDS